MGITNSLEAFKEMRHILNEYHKQVVNVDCTNVCGYPLDKIESELNVAKILKEKKVNLEWFDLITCKSNKVLMNSYNEEHIEQLTLEEVTAIVEWLKRE